MPSAFLNYQVRVHASFFELFDDQLRLLNGNEPTDSYPG
jgi:hypothetical protein